MRAFILMTTAALTFTATAHAATKVESFERKLGRFAAGPASSAQKAMCACREPFTGLAGRLVYRRNAAPTFVRSFTLLCEVPNFGPTGEPETHGYCQDFTILTK